MRAEGGPYRADEIARACGGRILCGDPGTVFDAISTDSRDIRPNDLFVPLKGAQLDGHEFLFPALRAGARGSLVDRDINRDILSNLTNYVLIQVQDTLHAISDLASTHRRNIPTPLIAVTGSSGKTTTREMIAAVLRRSHRPLVSQGNLNNMIGLPMTVLAIKPEHTIAVVEAGINTVGEMDHLARAAVPDVAVITTVGPVHLEGLGSIENVAREKFKLVLALSSRGTAVLPAGDSHLEPLTQEFDGHVLRFGIEQGDFRAEKVQLGDVTRFEMITPQGRRAVEVHIPGRHNVSNALAAAAACTALGISIEDVVAGLAECVPPALRMEVLTLSGNRRLIRDCYNANPQSMCAALDVLAQDGSGSGTLAILADMMELGTDSATLHEEVGRYAAGLGIDRLIFVGNFGPSFVHGFISAGGTHEAVTYVADKDAAWNSVSPDLARYGAILVKGSRAMRMELIADRILEVN